MVTAVLILGALHKMMRSATYEYEPRWIRWAWTTFYALLALAMAFFVISLPA